jgi:hypothetical protein
MIFLNNQGSCFITKTPFLLQIGISGIIIKKERIHAHELMLANGSEKKPLWAVEKTGIICIFAFAS